LFEADNQYGGRECLDNFCGCEALKDYLYLRLSAYNDELTGYYVNYEAAKTVLGEKYARTFLVLGNGLYDCEFEAPFATQFQRIRESEENALRTRGEDASGALENDAAYLVKISARPLQSELLEANDFAVEVTKILGVDEVENNA
jgi:hypothetical protein